MLCLNIINLLFLRQFAYLHSFVNENFAAKIMRKNGEKKNFDGNKYEINCFTNKPYSSNYYRLLESRKKLPVYRFRSEIIKTCSENKIIIIEGDTGSGKTTQIPQFLIESCICPSDKIVVCTQPRRVAAINVSSRVAEEMDVELGSYVGYNVRFDNNTSEQSRLVYMTDGLLLREFITDSLIKKYGAVIIDEAHERTINSDLILGLLKKVLETRDDLFVIVMSATINADKFIDFFTIKGKIPPHIKVPGKMYHVECFYSENDVDDYIKEAIDTVYKIHTSEDYGDILVFLTGEDEINTAVAEIKKKCFPTNSFCEGIKVVNVLPLFSTLSPKEQAKCFEKSEKSIRKIIISTNIAETSITIDGVVYVIDCGLIKQATYNPIRRMKALQPTKISKAAAVQRAGRAGRTQPGKCYRLYTKDAFENSLPEQQEPEINRSNLTAFLLLMVSIGIKNLKDFYYIDPPNQHYFRTALLELQYLGAIDNKGQLTEIGKLMSYIPLDPCLSKALIASKNFGCNTEVSAIVSMLSDQSQIFLRPRDKKNEYEKAHSRFRKNNSDHLSMLAAFEEFQNNPTKEFCETNFLNYRALENSLKSKGQILLLLGKINVPILSIPYTNNNRGDLILQSLLEGLFLKIAMRDPISGLYQFPSKIGSANIHIGSTCKDGKPNWVIYGDYVLISDAYITNVSEIKPNWIVPSSVAYFKFLSKDNSFDGLIKTEIRRLTNEYIGRQGF